MTNLAERWQTTFWQIVCQQENAEALKPVATGQQLGIWTTALTKVAVETCQALGWQAAARGHRLDLLPQPGDEYLGLDVTAFSQAELNKRWRFPLAIVELENSRYDDRVAYSLWKVLCVRAELRMVFCYRPQAEEGAKLVKNLAHEVWEALSMAQRSRLEGQIVVVIGNRAEAGTFPYGFFKWWQLEKNTGDFRLM